MKQPTNVTTSKRYQQLLTVLMIVFCIAPFLKSNIGSVFSAVLLLYTLMVIIRSLPLPKVWVAMYTVIALVASVLQLSASMDWVPSFNLIFALIGQSIYALYLGTAALWISRDIISTTNVTADTVRGGISVYLLIGFVWALFYGLVATLDSNAFSQSLLFKGSYLTALHFSFTTLTTLGYGDIVPFSDIALVLTNLEAIIGQLYPAVFISILVGGFLSGRFQKTL